MEMQKNRTWQKLCDWCQQRKMACHWDLVGITGPQDPNMLKQACRMAKKPVINIDNLKDAGNGTAPSLVTDLVASTFLFGMWLMCWSQSQHLSGGPLCGFMSRSLQVLIG
jgi:hypothetical protein